MPQHLRQSSIGPQLLKIIQTVSAHTIQQHEAFHNTCFVIAALPLLDVDMLRYALRHSQAAQRADQQRCAAVRRPYLRSRNRIGLEEKFRCSG